MSEVNNSVMKALEILELFAQYETLTVAEMHELTGFSKSAINRIVSSCEEKNFLYRKADSIRFSLGNKLYYLGNSAGIKTRIVDYVKAPLEKLSRKLKVTISVSIMEQYESVVIYQRKSEMVMGLVPSLGSVRPLNCSATGKVLASFCDRPEQTLELMEFRRFTGKTIMAREEYARVLRQTRREGYAVDDEEIEENLFCIAMPVLSPRGELLCSISLSGGKKKMTGELERMREELGATIKEIGASGIF